MCTATSYRCVDLNQPQAERVSVNGRGPTRFWHAEPANAAGSLDHLNPLNMGRPSGARPFLCLARAVRIREATWCVTPAVYAACLPP